MDPIQLNRSERLLRTAQILFIVFLTVMAIGR